MGPASVGAELGLLPFHLGSILLGPEKQVSRTCVCKGERIPGVAAELGQAGCPWPLSWGAGVDHAVMWDWACLGVQQWPPLGEDHRS